MLLLKNINLLLVNPEEALATVRTVVDIKGLGLVLNHLNLEELYIKSEEAFSFLECKTKNSNFKKLKSHIRRW